MDKKKFKLAKKYMIYRYNRALVRKKNTTDESYSWTHKKSKYGDVGRRNT